MPIRIPSRRLGQCALAAFTPRTTRWVPAACLPSTAHRAASSRSRKRAPEKDYSIRPAGPQQDEPAPPQTKTDEDLSNPILEKYLKQREIEEGVAPGEDAEKKPSPRPSLREGTMSTSPSSLFLPERELPGYRSDLSPSELAALRARAEDRKAAIKAREEQELLEMNLDPDKKARRSLERKLVIKSVRRHGRLTKAQSIARTERQSLFKSQNLPTSVKKLQKVVNQIAGKTVSEALVQLRFSKKKVARDVIKGLEMAQNEAIARRGMGLGSGKVAQRRWEMQRNHMDSGKSSEKLLVAHKTLSNEIGEKTRGPVKVEMKDGSKKIVRDPTEIYIDQTWVGKGDMWKTPEFRARGAVNMLTHQTTSFSVLLKEEKTRMRISDEIKKKRDNRKLWTALPDRPVTTQRQYCLW